MSQINEGHDKECDLWYSGNRCTCTVRWRGYEDDDIPIRVSKSAKPKHGVSGRSIFTLWDLARRVRDGK